MLKIRLTRTGKTQQETFRIVVAEHKNAVKGKYLELLGHHQPSHKEKATRLNKERIEYWMSKGAQPSSTMAALLKKNGFGDMDKFMYTRPQRSKKKGAEGAAAGAPAVPAAEKKKEAKA